MSAKCDHIDLYFNRESAECRAVLITGKRLNIQFNLIEVSESNDERNDELKKLNQLQTLPTINDNGFVVWESRAVMQYLVNKYFPDNDLYPKDLQKRSTIHRLMYFDIGTLRKAFRDYKGSMRSTENPDEIVESRLWEKLKLLDSFLKDNKYVAGDKITIADISIFTTVNEVRFTNYNLTQFRKLNVWFENLKAEFGEN